MDSAQVLAPLKKVRQALGFSMGLAIGVALTAASAEPALRGHPFSPDKQLDYSVRAASHYAQQHQMNFLWTVRTNDAANYPEYDNVMHASAEFQGWNRHQVHAVSVALTKEDVAQGLTISDKLVEATALLLRTDVGRDKP